MSNLDEEVLQDLYQWIDQIPLSRPKKNLGRDFSDGVLVAEVIRHFFPRMVELHNYTPANSTGQKVVNWQTLNRKLLSRLGFSVTDDMIQALVTCKAGAMELLINNLKTRIEGEQVRRKAAKTALEHDEGYTAAAARAAQREQQNAFAARERLPRRRDTSHQELMDTWPNNGLASDRSLPPLSEPSFSTGQPMIHSWNHAHTDPGSTHFSSLPDHVHLPVLGQHNHITGGGAPVLRNSRPMNRSWQSLGQDMNLVLEEKEQTIYELQETVQLLQMKVRRLEHLLRVKDLRIEDLTQRLQVVVADKKSHDKKKLT